MKTSLKIINFYDNLEKISYKSRIEVLNPYISPEVKKIYTAFYHKFFDDNNKKTKWETLTNMARRAAQAGLQIQNKLHNKEMAPGVFLSVKCGIGVGDVCGGVSVA